MLPELLLRHSVRGDTIVPHFLGEADRPWLRALLDEVDRFCGRPQRELEDRLRETPPPGTPVGKRRLAIHVLCRLLGRTRRSVVPSARAREAAFRAAAQGSSRAAALVAAASQLAVAVPEVEALLFGDLPGERLVLPPGNPISPLELGLRANLVLAQGFLFRATSVVIEVEGNARALVRHAKLRGLICTVGARGTSGDAMLDISGPFALFRRTLVYGRALGELLPLCAWCDRFRLRARCLLNDRCLQLELATGDPIFPSEEPRRFDSRVEERFARDFARLAREWDVIREPEPIAVAGTLIFPDFALQHRYDVSRRWLLEIMGFWTVAYVERKLAQYRAAGLSNLILCIDEERECADGALPPGAVVVPYRRRVDAQAVLAMLERNNPSMPTGWLGGEPCVER